MRIEPCKEDVKAIVLFILPFILLSMIVVCYLHEWNLFFIVICSLVCIIFILGESLDITYLGRSFMLNGEGWTISIGKYQKTYSWDEITVTYCKNDHGISLNDWVRPGILLTASPLKKPSRLTAMPTCIYHHPVISVFLRFRTDDTNYIAARVAYEGYVVEKEELLAFFKENHIKIEDEYLIR